MAARVSSQRRISLITVSKLNKSRKLNNNRLTTVPPMTFAGLVYLQSLELQSNVIISLPPGIFNDLTSLETLYVFSVMQLAEIHSVQ